MFKFVKNAIFKGLIIMIPLVVVLLTIRELFDMMIQFATPLADLFPRGTFTEDIAADRVEPVAVTLDEFSLALTHFGMGLAKTLDKGRQPGTAS